MMRPFSSHLVVATLAVGLQPLCCATVAAAQSAGQIKAHPYADHVAQAARRFAIPERWIWAVMRQESRDNALAVSHAGAIGLMQIMPATWADLRVRHGLGHDPFAPHDNIQAGAAYLREMYDRYGLAGMLAAYNAGPRRYEEYMRSGRPLPAETQAYLRILSPAIGASVPAEQVATVTSPALPWTQASLFPGRAGRASTQEVSPSGLGGESNQSATRGSADGLFILVPGRKP
ncbi:lytic transglycosylase domain-containing protein [Sphingobium sp.]|uniref:lytic transglycosylase domain-containing protein n=1 Tax=Sphingobium sp. TaxID=1912891 RepID=UPI003B3AE763